MIKKIFSEKHEKTLLILLGATFLTIVLMNLEFNLLESNLYDLRVIYSTHFKPSPEIVLIALDDASTKKLNEFSPLPLNYHTELLETLEKYKPKAIGYIVDMNRVSELNAKTYQSKWSKRFIESVQRLKHKGIPFIFGTPFDVTGEVVPPFPLSKLSHSIAVIHKDGNIFSEDKVTRRALTYLNEKPVFHLSLAQSIKTAEKEKPVYNYTRPKGSFFVPELESEQFFFRYHSSTDYYQKHIPYKTVSFASILENKNISPNILNGKILLIGTISKDDSSDFTFTPYSKKTFTHPKLLVHANILDSLLQNDGIVLVPKWANWIITFACTAFVIGWVIYSTPLYGVFSTLGLVIGFVLSLLFLFNTKGLWIRASQPLVGIFVSYYLIVPYRLILEYKKRWNFQKKSELLVQVEELKTNFLSLVTHDLKTPVARIQGLAEVLLRKTSERLLDKEKESLQNIISSTEELNRFISSILELTKVESGRIHLKLESKDPNQVIERSITSFESHVHSKKIKINTELEPLFSIKMDVSLISKVINNLIDNAIKYSTPGSEICIKSREFGDWIEISVQDHGIGITAEEMDSLFTKFYRAKNQITSKVSGTGLGLYLTKYFIEAHGGKVEVDSTPEHGSCFKILLPMNPPQEIKPEIKKENHYA